MTALQRIQANWVRFASRRALHDHRLAKLATERERLWFGIYVLLAATVVGAMLAAFHLVDIRGACLCLVAAWEVRAEWRRAWRETMAEHDDYNAFLQAQIDEATA